MPRLHNCETQAKCCVDTGLATAAADSVIWPDVAVRLYSLTCTASLQRRLELSSLLEVRTILLISGLRGE